MVWLRINRSPHAFTGTNVFQPRVARGVAGHGPRVPEPSSPRELARTDTARGDAVLKTPAQVPAAGPSGAASPTHAGRPGTRTGAPHHGDRPRLCPAWPQGEGARGHRAQGEPTTTEPGPPQTEDGTTPAVESGPGGTGGRSEGSRQAAAPRLGRYQETIPGTPRARLPRREGPARVREARAPAWARRRRLPPLGPRGPHRPGGPGPPGSPWERRSGCPRTRRYGRRHQRPCT
jgi:hypothetical protein